MDVADIRENRIIAEKEKGFWNQWQDWISNNGNKSDLGIIFTEECARISRL